MRLCLLLIRVHLLVMSMACFDRLSQRVSLELAALANLRRFRPVVSGLVSGQTPAPCRFCLRPGEVRSIDHASGELEISVRSGVFWVTEEAGSEDHIIEPGRVFRPSRRGRLVIEAFRPGCLLLHVT